MINSSMSKQSLAGLAILVLVAGCGSDNGGEPGPAASVASANPASANDFGGSGVVLNTTIAAPFVLFQNDSISRLINRDGGAVKSNGVNNIYSLGAYVDPNDSNRVKLFVNDRLNHRVLIFNTIPQDATALPDVVVGQADFLSGTANAGVGTSAAGFNENVHMSVCSNGKMLVSDRNNNRVLVYNQVPTANGTAADFVIGQPDFLTNTASHDGDRVESSLCRLLHGRQVIRSRTREPSHPGIRPHSHCHQSRSLLRDRPAGHGHRYVWMHGGEAEQSL